MVECAVNTQNHVRRSRLVGVIQNRMKSNRPEGNGKVSSTAMVDENTVYSLGEALAKCNIMFIFLYYIVDRSERFLPSVPDALSYVYLRSNTSLSV